MHKLLPALIDSMGDAYPELKEQQELITKVVKEEEESFLRTLATRHLYARQNRQREKRRQLQRG